jgi:RNA polymerase sigma-70 factor (ECF subfamily)
MSFPETNPSLLLRLRDGADEQAWFEFERLYRPAIVRLAQRKGLQPCDCDDLAQTVLLAVARAIERWEPDNTRAKFRTWLYTVANRQAIDALRRRATAAVSGGTSVQNLLGEEAERREDSRLLRLELRRQALQRAASLVRDEIPEAAWTAFWLMAVEGLPAAEVAQRVGKTVGAVYAAKGRVMRRLTQRIREMERDFPDDSEES